MQKPYPYEKRRFEDTDDLCRNNKMIKEFLKSDCDVLVKMDVDQVYPPYYFTLMVPLLEQYDIVGPKIHNKWRERDYRPLIFESNDFPYLAGSNPEKISGGVFEVPYPHTNLFYKKKVFDNIEPPWYSKTYNKSGTRRKNDMDFDFLDKIKDQGYKIYINTSVTVKHLVMEGVDDKLFYRWNRM